MGIEQEKNNEVPIMMSQSRTYTKIIPLLVFVWFIAVLSASQFLVFKDGRVPAGFAALVPIIVFVIWSAASPDFRRFILSADARTLTFLQAWRVAGFVWVVSAAYGILPAAFALPAGSGDLAVGLTAPLAATYLAKPERRWGFITWQIFGILDLTMAVTLAVLASPRLHLIGNGLTTAQLTVLPLSVIPTFAVPLVIIFHIICIAQWWKASPARRPRTAFRN
jgi:hypothetical protein